MRISALFVLLVACAPRRAADQAPATVAAARPVSAMPSCATPSQDTTFIQVSARFAGRPEALFARVAAVYAQEGFELAVADRAGGRVVSTPRFTWPADMAREAWHGDDHPGVQALSLLVPAGADSTVVSFEARTLCQVRAPGATAPSEQVGQQLKMLTALMLASAFAKAGKS